MMRLIKKTWPIVVGITCLGAVGCALPGAGDDFLSDGSGNVSLDGSMSKGDIRTVNISIARALEKQGQLDKAARLYEQLLEQKPGQIEVIHRLAIVKDKLGDQERAAELFRQAIAKNPKDVTLLADYGYSLYLAGDFEESQTILRKAVEIDAENARAQTNLGLVLCATHEYEEAEQAFARGGLGEDETQMNIAFAMSVEGRLEDARQIYAQLQSEDPSDEDLAGRIGQIDHLLAMSDGNQDIAVTGEIKAGVSDNDDATGTARVMTASASEVSDAVRVSDARHRETSTGVATANQAPSGQDEPVQADR